MDRIRSLCSLGLCAWSDQNAPYLEIFFTDLAAVAILLLTSGPSPIPTEAGYRVVALIGIYSYGIYLWQFAALRCTKIAGAHLHIAAPWFSNVVPYVSAILLGVIMSKLIEFPFLKLREIMVPSPHGSHLLRDPGK